MADRPLFSDTLITLSTSGAGNAAGTTVVASGAGQVNNFYQGMTIRIIASSTGSLVNEEREVISYVAATGTFLVDPAFTAQVPTATVIDVITDRPGAGSSAGVIVSAIGTAAAGSSATVIVDAARTEANDYWDGQIAIMLSGVNAGLSRAIRLSTLATTSLTVDPAFPNAVAAGDIYAIVALPHNSPTTDSTFDTLMELVLGRKADTAVNVSSAVASAMAYLKSLINQFGNITTHALTSIAAKWGNMPRSLYAVLGTRWDAAGDLGTDITNILAAVGGGVTDTDASVGPSNFFAGAITVLTFAPVTNEILQAVYLDVNGFTDNAILTAVINVRIGAGELQRVIRRTFVKGTANDGTLFPVIDGSVYAKDHATSIVITLQSDNAGDVAVTVPLTRWS